MKKYGLVQARKKCQNSVKVETTIHIVVSAVIAVIGILCVFGIYNNESLESAIGFAMAFIVGIGIYVFFSFKSLKTKIRTNAAKLRYIDEIDSEKTEREIESSEMLYDTFYMLEDYFYAPKSCLIIKYEDIAEFKNIIHSTNGIKDSVFIAITDKNDVMYEISVKKWKDYYKHWNSISEIIYEKQKNLVERKKI